MAAIPRLGPATYRRVERAATAVCVVLWALAGIVVVNLSDTPVVAIAAALGIIAMAVALLMPRRG